MSVARAGSAAGLLALVGAVVACERAPFRLEHFDLEGQRAVALNQPLTFEFSREVQVRSLRTPGPADGSAGAATLAVLDAETGVPVPGKFESSGRWIRFLPRLPRQADLKDGGLRPGRHYRVEIPGPPRLRTLSSTSGEPLARGYLGSFETVAEGQQDRYFVELVPGLGPKPGVAKLRPGEGRILLDFSQPLDPRRLGDAWIRLSGPWSVMANPQSDPRLTVALLENDDGALLELTMPATLPGTVDAQCSVVLDLENVRSLGGAALSTQSANPYVPVQVVAD